MHVAPLFLRLTAGGVGVFPPKLGGRSEVDPRLDHGWRKAYCVCILFLEVNLLTEFWERA